MTVNPQLKDYIDQQTKLGVSKDAVKAALLGAGWQSSDILEAMGGSAAPAAVSMPVQPKDKAPESVKPIGITPVQTKPSSTSFVASDIFRPTKDEPMFQSRAGADLKPVSPDKPQAVSLASSKKSFSGESRLKKYALPETIGLIAILFMGAAVFFYIQNADLASKVAAANQGSGASQAALTSLTAEKTDLTNQVASLNQTIADLANQLSLFAVPANASATQEFSITIKGMLGGGGKSPYSLMTNKDILVAVKNSADPKVNAALKPLLGAEVEISGTHAPRSNSVTVTAVNGAAPALPQAASTPSASTSTGTAATGTAP